MNPGQLRWRCRRGMRELDRAFLHVLEREYPDRDADFQSRFVAFTEEPDPDILAMLSGRAVAPPEYADIVEFMRHCGAFPAVSN